MKKEEIKKLFLFQEKGRKVEEVEKEEIGSRKKEEKWKWRSKKNEE